MLRRWSAPANPRRLALTRDGKFLAAVSGRSVQVALLNTGTGEQLWERTILDAFNLHGLTFSLDGKELIAAHIYDRGRSISRCNIEEGWAIDNRLSRLLLEPNPDPGYWQIALDVAAARPWAIPRPSPSAPGAIAWPSPRGRHARAAADRDGRRFRWTPATPGDFLDSALALHPVRFRRLPLGGRPLAGQFAGDGTGSWWRTTCWTPCRSWTWTGKLVRKFGLGGPASPSLARQGEAISTTRGARIITGSAATPATPMAILGRTFDTLNDDSDGNPKLTPTLRGVTTERGPGPGTAGRTDLGQAVESRSPRPSSAPSRPRPTMSRPCFASWRRWTIQPNPHQPAGWHR